VFSVGVAGGRGSYSDGGEVLCCTSGFVDDVMLSRDAKQRYSNSHTYDFDDFITAFDEKTYQCQDPRGSTNRHGGLIIHIHF